MGILMRKYARLQYNVVMEILHTWVNEVGQEIPIEQMFHPDVVSTLIELPGDMSINCGFVYENGAFVAPELENP